MPGIWYCSDSCLAQGRTPSFLEAKAELLAASAACVEVFARALLFLSRMRVKVSDGASVYSATTQGTVQCA